MTDRDRLFEFARTYLKSLIAESAGSIDADFDPATPFGDLGIDSFRVLRIVKSLEKDFGRLPKPYFSRTFTSTISLVISLSIMRVRCVRCRWMSPSSRHLPSTNPHRYRQTRQRSCRRQSQR